MGIGSAKWVEIEALKRIDEWKSWVEFAFDVTRNKGTFPFGRVWLFKIPITKAPQKLHPKPSEIMHEIIHEANNEAPPKNEAWKPL